MSELETAEGLHREFPRLWELAQQFDFAERMGGCTDPLLAEADGALRELFLARRNAMEDGCAR